MFKRLLYVAVCCRVTCVTQNTAGVYSRDVIPDKRYSCLHILRYTEVSVKITSL